MCGIAGELRLALGERARADRVRAMCDVMVHRGPDDEGLLAHAEVALGMRRLSIVDVSGGQQPLSNEDGSVQVVCNGEIYNSAPLRSALEARGHRFRSRSDVEVIAHLYEEEGVDAIGRLEGMFALALWDARRHRLLLARDRFGIKPLYLAETPRAILFGSEAKCLLAGGLDPVIDPQALHDYLTLGYVPDPTSIFVGARQLPAAHLMVAEPGDGGGRVRVERYWSLAGRAEPREQRSEAEWQEELARTLRAALRGALRPPAASDRRLAGARDRAPAPRLPRPGELRLQGEEVRRRGVPPARRRPSLVDDHDGRGREGRALRERPRRRERKRAVARPDGPAVRGALPGIGRRRPRPAAVHRHHALPPRRPARQVGPHEHGALARGARALPRSRGRGARAPHPAPPPTAAPAHQAHAAPGDGGPPAGADPPAAQDGVQPPARGLARRRAQGLCAGRARARTAPPSGT